MRQVVIRTGSLKAGIGVIAIGLVSSLVTQSLAQAAGDVSPIQEWEHLSGDWGGHRAELEDQGSTIEPSLIVDYSSNWHGGVNTNGTSFRHLFIVDLTLDTEALLGLEGGTIFLEFYNHNGEDGSEDAGDFQAYSNINADGRSEIAEFWYEQILMDGKVRIKFCKVEANAEFAYVDNGREFINSSMGFSPAVFVLPTYPELAMSLNVFVYPQDNIYLSFGLFGSLQEGVLTGSRGPKTFFDRPGDLFVIGEAGVTWGTGNGVLPGRLGYGAWGHTGTFGLFDGGIEDGTLGFYFLCRSDRLA